MAAKRRPTNRNRRSAQGEDAGKNKKDKTAGSKSSKKRRYNGNRGFRFFTVAITFILVGLVLGWMAKQPGSEIAVSSSEAPQTSDAGQDTAQAESGPGFDNADWNIAGPIARVQENVQPVITPDYRMIALPENGRVARSYFDTVTFVGDSITQGLQIYGTGLANASYCAYKSIGPKGMYDGSEWPNVRKETEVPMDALVASQPDNVYVLLGANAMGSTQDDVLIEYYRTLLQKMQEVLLPGVSIYVQSITPVAQGAKFSMERITELNNRLAQMAYEAGVYFVDLNEALAGDDGYLRPEFATKDGIHMQPSGYAAWVDYLETHTAYHPRNPYIESSPYIPPGAPPPEAPPPEEQGEEV